MKIECRPKATVKIGDVGKLKHRETALRMAVLQACQGAIRFACDVVPLPLELNAGIALFTVQSERWPYVWRELVAQGGKVWPSQFEGIIHNAAAGYAAIELGLIGPQLTLVQGNIEAVARLQLLTNRSRFMLVCYADLFWGAECYVMEAAE